MANQGNVAEAAANKPLQCLYCDVKFTSLIDVLRHNSSAQHNARMQEVNGVSFFLLQTH